MSITDKLFSFQGRLRRRDWWLFGILLALGGWVVSSVAMATMGVSMMALLPMGASGSAADIAGVLTKVIEIQCAIFVVLLWPGLAIGVKRLHDRNRPGWLIALPYALSVANQVLTFQGMQSGLAGMMHPSPLRLCVSLLLVVIGLWMLIELGFLDGTQGPNKYGPSPKGFGVEEVGFTT